MAKDLPRVRRMLLWSRHLLCFALSIFLIAGKIGIPGHVRLLHDGQKKKRTLRDCRNNKKTSYHFFFFFFFGGRKLYMSVVANQISTSKDR